jgi:tRNA pseudouridine55 synthase
MDAILLIDKPQGWTSHDVVGHIRKTLKLKKAGHCGTLDPLASGLLVILTGRTTKLSEHFTRLEKQYSATMKIGSTTDTADSTGRLTREFEDRLLEKERIEKTMQTFLGESLQVPPMVSAVKINGKRLYQIARKGRIVPEGIRKPRVIKISNIELKKYEHPFIEFDTCCSSGTYIRTLIEDIAKKLDTGAHMVQLRRTMIGCFDVKDALPMLPCLKNNS